MEADSRPRQEKIGPADLSISLGVAGQMEHPKLVDAVTKVIEICEKHGRFPSIQVRDPALAKTWIQRGMKLVGCGPSRHRLRASR